MPERRFKGSFSGRTRIAIFLPGHFVGISIVCVPAQSNYSFGDRVHLLSGE
jgi:hypothetical protein